MSSSSVSALPLSLLGPAPLTSALSSRRHPSGFFVRGDPSQLNKIVRKARTRPEKGRRASECSTASDETYPSALHPYPMPAWPPSTDYRPSFSTDRPFLQLPSLGSSFHTGAAPPPPPRLDTTQWRAYAPTTGAWVDPNRNDADRFGPPTRRSSLGEFKLSGTSTSTTTTMAGQPAPYAATLSSLQEEQRPRLRKAFSSTSVPTDEHGHPHPHRVYQDQHEQHHHAPQGFRGSPYPTPTFSPTSNTFFDAHPGYHHASASGVTATTSAFTSAPHMSYDASPFASSYHPIAPSQPSSSSLSGAATKGARALTHSYHTPSPDHSPLHQVVGLPALVETVPPLGHPAHPATTTSERHSPRSSTSYAPLPPMQARFASNSSATTSHAPWQPAQTLAPAQSQAQGYGGYASYAPLPTTTAPMSAPSQWSPAPIRSAY